MSKIEIKAKHFFVLTIGSYLAKYLLNHFFDGIAIQSIGVFLEFFGMFCLVMSIIFLFKEKFRWK